MEGKQGAKRRKMHQLKWLVLWSLWAGRMVDLATPPVTVSGGQLRGTVSPDGSHARYLAIPYAKAKRFQDSIPYTWEDVFDAINENSRCAQRQVMGGQISSIGEEDCLTLNVYTPLPQRETLLPVMVFIHGGGFREGSGTPFLYGPEYLVEKDVVLVTINYRLEILGFLCLGIKEAPGNVGLKDQVLALKWVKQNIKNFGGDPDNVAIFGESAGAASVGYHLVSPMSKGLFHKAVLESGTSITPWALQFEPLTIARKYIKQLGYDIEDPTEIYDILNSKPHEQLLTTRVPRKEGDMFLSENIFVPCIEKELPGVNRFLPEAPYNLLVKGKFHKVPIIIGFNNEEGYMFVGKENKTTIPKLQIVTSLPRDLSFPTQEDEAKTALEFKDLYMKDKEISEDNLLTFSKYVGDATITYPVVITADILAITNSEPVYAYKFSYDGKLNLAKILYGFRKEKGATHADELFYIFKVKVSTVPKIFEQKMINRMTELWTNFAKFGNPTPELTSILPLKWSPLDKTHANLMVIDEECSIEPLWSKELLAWDATYKQYRRTNLK